MRYSFIVIVALAVLLAGCASEQAPTGVPDGQESPDAPDDAGVETGAPSSEAGDAVLPGANGSSEELVDDDLDRVMGDLSMDDW
ncbi:hypothetical protein KY327_01770 [Candidatus Woesearchaeota archaeon]|nr:hypothetical protein [Candidatus Woesearchaeota archaeon]